MARDKMKASPVLVAFRLLACTLLLCIAGTLPAVAQTINLPAVAQTINLPALTATPTAGGGQTYSLSIQILVLLTAITFLPGLLSGTGVRANYSYTTSQASFPISRQIWSAGFSILIRFIPTA